MWWSIPNNTCPTSCEVKYLTLADIRPEAWWQPAKSYDWWRSWLLRNIFKVVARRGGLVHMKWQFEPEIRRGRGNLGRRWVCRLVSGNRRSKGWWRAKGEREKEWLQASRRKGQWGVGDAPLLCWWQETPCNCRRSGREQDQSGDLGHTNGKKHYGVLRLRALTWLLSFRSWEFCCAHKLDRGHESRKNSCCNSG